MIEKTTFSNLVDEIAQETGASKRLIHDLLIEMGNITKEGLERDGRVNLSGFGNFDLKWHETRLGRNPQTGEEIEIPAHNTINFNATSTLRKYINRKYAHLKPEFIGEEETEEPVIPAVTNEPEPGSKPVPAKEEKTKKSVGWLWLIIPIIFIILALIFWSSNKAPEPVMEEQTQSDVLAEDSVGEPGDSQQPNDQIDQTEAPAEDIKTESDISQKTVEKPALLKEESTQTKKEPVYEKVTSGTPGGIHSVQPGDKLWTIAREYYKESYLWPNIYRVNLDKVNNPDVLTVGKNVEIPSLQGKPGNLSKQDKIDIAEGFVEVYLIYKKIGKEKAQYYLWVVNKWEARDIIEKFKGRINEEDLIIIGKINGNPVIE